MSGIQFVTDEKGRKVGVPNRPEKTLGHLGRLLGQSCIRIAPKGKGHSF
jgi:hypothetical protein